MILCIDVILCSGGVVILCAGVSVIQCVGVGVISAMLTCTISWNPHSSIKQKALCVFYRCRNENTGTWMSLLVTVLCCSKTVSSQRENNWWLLTLELQSMVTRPCWLGPVTAACSRTKMLTHSLNWKRERGRDQCPTVLFFLFLLLVLLPTPPFLFCWLFGCSCLFLSLYWSCVLEIAGLRTSHKPHRHSTSELHPFPHPLWELHPIS